jgi:hypothetical protein
MVDEEGPEGNFLKPVNVESSLFFESAPELFRRVHREIRPRTPVPGMEVEYKGFAMPTATCGWKAGQSAFASVICSKARPRR